MMTKTPQTNTNSHFKALQNMCSVWVDSGWDCKNLLGFGIRQSGSGLGRWRKPETSDSVSLFIGVR